MQSALSQFSKLILKPHFLVVLLFGFSSGIPLALVGTTLQAWYTVSGIHIVAIGALTLVGQPYVFKFIWAPIIDRFPLRFLEPWVGRRCGWVMVSQWGVSALLFAMAWMNPRFSPFFLAFLAMGVAFFSATQDVVIDAYRTELLQVDERSMGAALATMGYRVAMLCSGGIALMTAHVVGWRVVYAVMAGVMLLMSVVTWFAPEHGGQTLPMSLRAAVVEPFKEFLSRPKAIYILVFIVLYKLSYALSESLNTVFFLRGLHFNLLEVGAIYKGVGFFAIILGSFLGGFLLTRMRLVRGLIIFGAMQAGTLSLFMVMAIVGKHYSLMVVSVFLENVCLGLEAVAFVTLVMTLCDLRYTATQFALLTAIASLPRIYLGSLAAYLQTHVGWVMFYFISAVIMLPSLILLGYHGLRGSSEEDPVIARAPSDRSNPVV